MKVTGNTRKIKLQKVVIWAKEYYDLSIKTRRAIGLNGCTLTLKLLDIMLTQQAIRWSILEMTERDI
jgi:hypothetical protein